MLILFMILLTLAGGLILRRRQRTAVAVAVLAVVQLLVISTGWLPRLLLADLQTGLTPETRLEFASTNTIVLLGLGTEDVHDSDSIEVGTFAFGRLVKTFEVFQACVAAGKTCRVLVTGGDPQSHGATEAKTYAARLQKLGVPRDDLIIEDKSRNTWENAANSQPLIEATGAEKVFLVTSGIHMKRSLVYFRHFGVVAEPVRADYLSVYSVFPQFYNAMVFDLAFHEYLGMARYSIYNLLGWNPPPTT